MTKPTKPIDCCICGVTFTGWGHNPVPFGGERCCDDCNSRFVIPARLVQMGNTELTVRDYALLKYFASTARAYVRLDEKGKEITSGNV